MKIVYQASLLIAAIAVASAGCTTRQGKIAEFPANGRRLLQPPSGPQRYVLQRLDDTVDQTDALYQPIWSDIPPTFAMCESGKLTTSIAGMTAELAPGHYVWSIEIASPLQNQSSRLPMKVRDSTLKQEEYVKSAAMLTIGVACVLVRSWLEGIAAR